MAAKLSKVVVPNLYGGTTDVYSELLEFKWRGKSFPTSTFSLKLRHDLAQHKYPGRDGADVEATGVAPLEISAKIPFRNGVSGARSETWPDDSKPLYPVQYREFMKACKDRSVGELQHPEFGNIQCRIVSADTVWDATRRDGVDVDVAWLETIDEKNETFFAGTSPIVSALSAATALDDAIRARVSKQQLPDEPEYEPNFSDMVRSVQQVSDRFQTLNARLAGRLNSVVYRVNALKQSIQTSADAKDWPIVQAIEQLKSACNQWKRELVPSGRTIVYYVVPKDATLASIAIDTGAPMGDLIMLNPILCAYPVILKDTIVRYYRA